MTVHELIVSIRDGKFAHGGYPKFWLTSDGGTLSYEAVRENLFQIVRSTRDNRSNGWCVVACAVNWEDSALYCDHTGKRIASAYAEDEINE